MRSLTVPELDTRLTETLRLRAARNGRSVEAEVRAILAEALTSERAEPDLAEAIRARFAPVGGVERAPHLAVTIADPPRFER